MAMSNSPPPPSVFKPYFWIGAATLLACLILMAAIDSVGIWHWLLISISIALIAYLSWLFSKFSSAQRDYERYVVTAKIEIETLSLEREVMARELTQLGSYGNLLHGCPDLAAILQVSQQLLAQLLPGGAHPLLPLHH